MSVRFPAGRMLLVLLVVAAARLVPVAAQRHVSPDAVEYLDIAARARQTGQPLLGIKAYYYVASPVVHYANSDRPVGAALFVGALGGRGEAAVARAQGLNLALAVLTALCIVLAFRRAYGWGPALAGALVAGLCPAVVTVSLYPWAEVPAILCVVLVLLVLAESDRDLGGVGRAKAGAGLALGELCAGLALGLAASMRPTHLVLVFPVAIYLLVTRRTAAARMRGLVLLLVGPGLFVCLNGMMNLANGAAWGVLPQQFLYRVRGFEQGMWSWDGRHLPDSMVAFLAANGAWVARQVAKHAVAYGYTLVFHHEYLFVWCVALVAAAWRARQKALPALATLALGMAAVLVGVYAVSWSTYDAVRFLALPLSLVLPVCVGEAFAAWDSVRIGASARLTLPRVLVGLTVVAWGLLAAREGFESLRARQAGQRWSAWETAEPSIWNDPALDDLCTWITRNLNPDDAVASPFPWATAVRTSRPALLWPGDLGDASRLTEYLAACAPKAIVFDPTDAHAAVVQALLANHPAWGLVQIDRFRALVRCGEAGLPQER